MRRMYSPSELAEMIKTSPKNLSSLYDDAGNPRFLESNIGGETISGLTFTYTKFALSGFHLMIVICGSIEDTTSLTANTLLCKVDFAHWLAEKIVPVVGQIVSTNQTTLWGSDYTTQTLNVNISKDSDKLEFRVGQNITLTKDRTFRLEFDLLID